MTGSVVSNDYVVNEVAKQFAESNMLPVSRDHYSAWPLTASAFENEYAVVGVWLFDNICDLIENWGIAQDYLVDLIGSNVASNSPKSWDGYLILISMSPASEDQIADLSNIRSDTRRVRKLIITSGDFSHRVSAADGIASQVKRALAPLLDIDIGSRSEMTDPLYSLFERLSKSLDAHPFLDDVVQAYEQGESMLSRLHNLMPHIFIAEDSDED